MCGDVEQCPGPGNFRRNISELTSLTNNKGMKIFHQNVRGLFGNLGHVSELLQSFPGIDILSLSETHIEAGFEQEEAIYDVPGYSFINRSRKFGKGGGVGAYIGDGVVWDRRYDLENDNIEAIWIEIWPKHSKSFLVGIMYRPPDSSKYLSKDFNNHLNSMLSKVSEKSQEKILMGDLNVNFLKQNNKEFKAILSVFGLKQMVEKPTRVAKSSETLIDVILTNNPANMIQTEVIPTSIGGHDMVDCARKLNHSGFKPRNIVCRDYKNYRPEEMNKDLEAIDWSTFYICRNVNEAWSPMKNTLEKLFERHSPKIHKNVRSKPAPWLNTEVKKLMNDRDKLLRKSRRTRAEVDISHYKRKRNEVNIAIRKAKSTYHKDLLRENSANPNKFWKAIKSIYPTKAANAGSSMHSFDLQGENTNDVVKVANGFCTFFTTIVTTSPQGQYAIELKMNSNFAPSRSLKSSEI
eukprot:gene7243-12925_t